jgi:hypothetical protein
VASLALLVSLVGFGTAAFPSVALPADKGEARKCTRHSGQGSPGPALKPAVKLVPDNPGEVVNFGGSGGREFVDVVLNATPALPKSLQPSQIRIVVLRRFTRSSQTLRREAAPVPTFTEPTISPNRDRVTFTVCLDGSGLKAGSYTGSVYIEGPRGLSPASVSITENATDSSLALGGTIGALVAAFFFLWLRGAAARQAAAEQTHAEQLANAAAAKDQARIDKLSADKPKPVRSYLFEVFKDLNWVITTLVALGAAFGTIIGIYNANPAWGADTLGSVASLVGPAFTAVGVQSVVASLGRSVTKS